MERLSRPMFKWAALGKPICTWPRRTVAGKTLFGQAPDRGYDPAFVRAGAGWRCGARHSADECRAGAGAPIGRQALPYRRMGRPKIIRRLRHHRWCRRFATSSTRLREYVGQRRDNQTLRTETEYNEAMPTLRTFEQTTREE
eukprot:jgi/Tetstr1/461689/TSEL_006789.t1